MLSKDQILSKVANFCPVFKIHFSRDKLLKRKSTDQLAYNWFVFHVFNNFFFIYLFFFWLTLFNFVSFVFIQGKFTEISVIRIYFKMCELWVDPGNNNLFWSSLLLRKSKVSKKTIHYSRLKSPSHKLAKRNKLVLPEEYCKSLKSITVFTVPA